MANWHKSRYLSFGLADPSASGKTWVWSVRSKGSGLTLGMVRWHGPWRQYVFAPSPHTVFNPDCQEDIAAFCREMTQRHREQASESPALRDAVEQEVGT